MSISDNPFLTSVDIAKELSVSVERVRGWITSDQLQGFNLGDGQKPRWKISRESIMAFLNSKANFIRDAQKPKRSRRRMPDVEKMF